MHEQLEDKSKIKKKVKIVSKMYNFNAIKK